MGADFSGFATKAGLKCADGRVIMPDAFAHQDKKKVPLVYQHVHDNVKNVIGHALLEARSEGMYAHAFLNNTPEGQHAREMVQHGDVESLSIYANRLMQEGEKVKHGYIREVSLVLAGANPGALIDFVAIRHGDGTLDELDEVVIYTGENIVHADGEEDDPEDKTVEDVYNSMTDEQKTAVHYMLAKAFDAGDGEDGGDTLEQSDTQDDPDTEDKTDMGNIFEKGAGEGQKTRTLTHDELKSLIATAASNEASLKKTIEEYAAANDLTHGILGIEALFPEAKVLTTTPTWDKRRTEWVSSVVGAANKTPFSRIKTWTADITYEEARALGYVKGDLKKEEWFTLSSRVTTPQTIYKKQSIDRDDMIDITDFDVVAWKKGEMRVMIEEELGRAILIGDGRAVDDPNKIREDKIRPIMSDHPYYTKTVGIAGTGAKEDVLLAIDGIVASRHLYKGSGDLTFFTSEEWLGLAMTLRDEMGHRLYRTLAELSSELRVNRIVTVPLLNTVPGLVGVLVDMNDYTVGADKGGALTMFDDFDIDYNKYKYLLETRCSGALTLPSSAIVVYNGHNSGKTVVTPAAPTYDPETGTVTITATAGVKYFDANNVEKTGDVVIPAGGSIQLFAMPADDTKIIGAGVDSWSFLRVPS